jgi:hypothetical protein
VIVPPAIAATAGQFNETAMLGAVTTLQVVETAFVTRFAVQASAPVLLKAVVTEQTLAGTATLAVKLAEAPGASDATVNTVVFGDGRFATTTTFAKVIFPVFRTVAL